MEQVQTNLLADGGSPKRLPHLAIPTFFGLGLLAVLAEVAMVTMDLGSVTASTGFSSFTYLKHIPAQYLKIDIEFIRELEKNPADQQLVQAIVSIARGLGQKTVAEGVEDEETLTTVRKLGVDYAQGFHLGRPEPTEPDRSVGASPSASPVKR